MSGCVYAHIGDDGAVLCDQYSDFGSGIISYCDDNCTDKRPSNADRIRSLSDEELAEFLEMIPHSGNPSTYSIDGFCIDDGLRSKRQWLDWLKEEARTNDSR